MYYRQTGPLSPIPRAFVDVIKVLDPDDDTAKADSKFLEFVGNIVAVVALVCGLVAVMLHRMMPEVLIRADLFSMDHHIRPGHAPRRWHTKLGTGMSISFAFSAVGVCALYSLGDNLLVSSSLHASSEPVSKSIDTVFEGGEFGFLETKFSPSGHNFVSSGQTISS